MTARTIPGVAVCESCQVRPATATVTVAGAEPTRFFVCDGCTPPIADARFPDGAPPIEFMGTVRLHQPLTVVLGTLALLSVPPVAAFTTFAVTDSPVAMMLAGLAGLLFSLVVDYQRRPREAKVLREVPVSSQDGRVIQRSKHRYLRVLGIEVARAVRLFGPLFLAFALMGLLMTLTEGQV